MTRAGSSGQALTSADDQLALDAVAELAPRGAVSVPELVLLFTHRSWVVRRQVVEALSRGDADVLGAVSRALVDRRGHEPTIAGLVDALSHASADATPIVAELLQHAEAAVLCDAIQIAGRRSERSAIPRLRELTRHADDNVALAAIEALGKIGGDEAVDELVAIAQGSNFFRVFPAIDGLGRAGDLRALPVLQELLQRPLYASEAARALGRIGHVAAVPPLVRALHGASDSLLRVLALTLCVIDDALARSTGNASAVRRFVRERASDSLREGITRALASADANERLSLGRLLLWIGSEQSVAEFVAFLEGTGEVATLAVDALAELDALGDPRVLEMVVNGTSELRSRLLPALMGVSGAERVALACLDDEAAAVRALSCHVLARSNATSAVPRLFELLTDSDVGVVHAAVSAIQSLGSSETERLALLAARSQDLAQRRAGCRIVLYFGYEESLELAREALGSADERLREIALAGLPVLEDPGVPDLLIRGASHPSARTRAAALRAMGQTTATPRTVDVLRSALDDPDPWVRYYACQALGRLRIESALPLLIERLQDSAGQVQTAAVEALAAIPGPEATRALAVAANSPNLDVRRAAVVGIGTRGDESLRPVLLEALASGDSALRLGALSSLSRMRGAELELERVAQKDPDAMLRRAALEHLAGRDNEEGTQALLRLLEHDPKSAEVSSALCQRLEARIPFMVAELERADDALSTALLRVISSAPAGTQRTVLEASSAFANVAARRAAAHALSLVSDEWAKSIAARLALSDADAEVRRICAAALA